MDFARNMGNFVKINHVVNKVEILQLSSLGKSSCSDIYVNIMILCSVGEREKEISIKC